MGVNMSKKVFLIMLSIVLSFLLTHVYWSYGGGQNKYALQKGLQHQEAVFFASFDCSGLPEELIPKCVESNNSVNELVESDDFKNYLEHLNYIRDSFFFTLKKDDFLHNNKLFFDLMLKSNKKACDKQPQYCDQFKALKVSVDESLDKML